MSQASLSVSIHCKSRGLPRCVLIKTCQNFNIQCHSPLLLRTLEPLTPHDSSFKMLFNRISLRQISHSPPNLLVPQRTTVAEFSVVIYQEWQNHYIQPSSKNTILSSVKFEPSLAGRKKERKINSHNYFIQQILKILVHRIGFILLEVRKCSGSDRDGQS